MARGRKASQTQSKLAMVLFGEEGTGKSSLALQLAYFKRPDGKPFRILYIDNENGSVDDFLGRLEDDGIDLSNIYIVYTQSLGETEEYINKVKNNEDFMELDDDGEETDNVVLDSEGNPFRADAIVVDGTSILKVSTQQGLVEFSKKRNAVKAKAQGLVGEERIVRIEGAQMELKDYQTLNFKGQNLVLDLMSSGAHFIITARETEEKQSVKDEKTGQITSVSTGKKIADGFKGMAYNVKTVIRMFKDEDGNFCADVSKDRTGVHNNEVVEDLSLLDWQSVIDKTKDKKSFVVKNDLNKAVDIETKIYSRELEKSGEINTVDTTPPLASSIVDYISQINNKMKSFSAPDKAAAKKALEAKGLPATPKAIKSETDEDVLKTVLEVIKAI